MRVEDKQILGRILGLEAIVITLLANDLYRKDERQTVLLHNMVAEFVQSGYRPSETADAQEKADHFEIKEGATAFVDRLMLAAQAVAAEMKKKRPPGPR